jgi:hypothetical protein
MSNTFPALLRWSALLVAILVVLAIIGGCAVPLR